MFAASNQASPTGLSEAFLCCAGRPHCAEDNSSSRYLLEGKLPTVLSSGHGGTTGPVDFFLRPVLGSAVLFVTAWHS